MTLHNLTPAGSEALALPAGHTRQHALPDHHRRHVPPVLPEHAP